MEFAKSRIFRLYPAVWLCATASFLVYLVLNIKHGLFATYFSAMLLIPLKGFAVYWSLGVEMIFYAAVFFWKLRLPSIALQRLAICVLIWSGAYLIAHLLGWHGLSPKFERILLLRHGVFFALGIFFWAGT